MGYRALQGERRSVSALPTCKRDRRRVDKPRAFSSCVHPRSSSCTSSGLTSVRSHASVHWGFWGASCSAAFSFACFLAALESLLRKTFEKKGILAVRSPEVRLV